MSNDLIVSRLESAGRLLAEASSPEQVKKIVDVAQAAEIYAKRQQLGDEAIGYAHKIKIDALSKLGEMLKVMPKAKGTLLRGSELEPRAATPTLSDIGIDKKTSMVAQQLASLSPEVREQIASRESSIADVLRSKRREDVRADRVERIAELSTGNAPLGQVAERYPVIYADPPWRYEHVETESRAIENQYPTMSLDEIKALQVSDIAYSDCVLFMWATSPKLAESLEVVSAWGFTYRTCAVWDKEKIGMGYYFRQQHELLLVATKGEPPTPKPGDRVSSVIREPRGVHSAKPARFYELIEAMYPELPKLEMFSRSPRVGWGAWGNQA